MKVKEMKKEELELLSYKDITNMLLNEKAKQNTAELFTQIVNALELPKSVFESKIGDYYMMLTTDKRFILLEDGYWDLRNRHTSDKIVKIEEDDDELEQDEMSSKSKDDQKDDDESYDLDNDNGDDDFDDDDDDLKDLVILDEEELEQ